MPGRRRHRLQISALDTFRGPGGWGWRRSSTPPRPRAAQDACTARLTPRPHRRIAAVRDAEIALRPLLTVSELARQTISTPACRREGARRGPGRRHGAVHAARRGGPARRAHLSFRRRLEHRKGLISASPPSRVSPPRAGRPPAVVGPRGDAPYLLEEAPTAGWSPRPTDQPGWPRAAPRDCLVLPSRNDSYAMVVAEAWPPACRRWSRDGGRQGPLTEGQTAGVPAGDVMPWPPDALAARHAAEVGRAGRLPPCRGGGGWPAYHALLAELLRRIVP